jgi:DNA polymerase III subunit epsilon
VAYKFAGESHVVGPGRGEATMNFTCIDVETANSDLASICQIGLVIFKDGVIADRWQSLVNPEDYFDFLNVSIHGIDEDAVRDAPMFPDICETVVKHLQGNVIASHTAFDRVAITRVFDKYQLAQPECTWLDTARVARRAWPEFSQRGYGLANVAGALDINFQHHNAQEDARAAGEILVRAIHVTGISLSAWFDRVKKPIDLSSGVSGSVAREGNPEGALYGETVVFTGALTIPRREAADLAASAGCQVADSVNKATTLLVVGDQDLRRLAGQEKSSKHRKAEELMSKGQAIRILGEGDFQRLVGIAS